MTKKFVFKPIPTILGLLCVVFAAWLQLTSNVLVKNWLTQFNNIAYDIQLRSTINKPNIDKTLPIAIVDVDDKSLKEQGRWPWSRIKMAELVSQLHKLGAIVVAFDMIFPEPERNLATEMLAQLPRDSTNPMIFESIEKLIPSYDYDKLFSANLALGDTILGITFHNQEGATQGVLPAPLLKLPESLLQLYHFKHYLANLPLLQQSAKNAGFINSFADADGVLRRSPLIVHYQDKIYPSLALATANLYLLTDKTRLSIARQGQAAILAGIDLDQLHIPTDEKGQVLVPFRGTQGSFPYLSATDILNKRIAPEAVKNKIIIMGTTATGLGDIHPVAVQRSYAGVEVHANIIAGILKNHFPYRPDWAAGAELIAILLVGLLFALIFPYLDPALLLIMSLAATYGLFQADRWLWQQQQIVLSVFVPMTLIMLLMVANLAYGYLFENRRRQQLREMFGQYVPAEHVEMMLQTKGDFGFSGESRDMSILFADIRNFTTISETMAAPQLKEMLNLFFTPMTEIIFKRRGTIDKYVGDMIMAFWGAPLGNILHANDAIETALEMQQTVVVLQEEIKTRYGAEVKIGIGINTGTVSVGDMGSKFRRAYTVLGDNVNLASRLEGISKIYNVGIVVGENTYSLAKDDFVFRPLDRVKVKGKEIAVEVYQPVCPIEQASKELCAELALFKQAMDYYYAQQWPEAETILLQLHEKYPEIYLYKLYIERVKALKATPYQADWDGVYTTKEKRMSRGASLDASKTK